MKKMVIVCLCGILIGACAADTTIPDMTAESLYQKAYKLFEKTDYLLHRQSPCEDLQEKMAGKETPLSIHRTSE